MTKTIESLIINIRGRNVILDADLAGLYGIPTGRLNEQVKRNADRFPPDFMFQLSRVEWQELKTTPKPSSTQSVELHYDNANPSQIATGSQKHRDPRFLPRVFTEHGALLAANVLNSPPAVKMSVFMVRASSSSANNSLPTQRSLSKFHESQNEDWRAHAQDVQSALA